MEEENQTLEEYLKSYGVEGDLTDKEKKYFLSRIIDSHHVDKDIVEFKYSKIPDDSITEEIRDEFINTIKNLDIKIIQARGYYYILNAKIKEERQLNRKETFQKVLSKFKIKK